MGVLGVSFNRMTIEKNKNISGDIKIANNVSVTNIIERKFSLGATSKNGLNFEFEFDCEYQPKLGTIKLIGSVLYMDDEKIVTEILDAWKKDKKIDPKVREQIINAALTKCSVQALKLSDDMGLPPPVHLPRVKQQ